MDQCKYLGKLAGKRVLVIGGSSGIGFAVAEASVEYGAHVTLSSSNDARLTAAVARLVDSYPLARDRIHGMACNLDDETDLEQRISRLLEHVGHIDHLVFTAGARIEPVAITNVTLDFIKASGAVRYTALLLVIKHIVPRLRRSPESSITLTTGVGLDKPLPGWSSILGPRVAVVGFGKALALDLRPVRVNVVAVGIANTGQFAHLAPDERDQTFAAIGAKLATGRVAEADDIAEAYLYCMRDRNVTGSVVSTNGGMVLM